MRAHSTTSLYGGSVTDLDASRHRRQLRCSDNRVILAVGRREKQKRKLRRDPRCNWCPNRRRRMCIALTMNTQ